MDMASSLAMRRRPPTELRLCIDAPFADGHEQTVFQVHYKRDVFVDSSLLPEGIQAWRMVGR